MSVRSFFCWMFCIVLSFACNSSVVHADVVRIDGNAWQKEDVKKFSFMAEDSIHYYDIYFIIRNNDNYIYSNIFLISSLSSPNGHVITDTLEYEMAKPSGEFLGKGFSIKESKLWYKERMKFLISEQPYELTISHAMRKGGNEKGIDALEGITDIGIIVEKSQNNKE